MWKGRRKKSILEPANRCDLEWFELEEGKRKQRRFDKLDEVANPEGFDRSEIDETKRRSKNERSYMSKSKLIPKAD